MKHAPPIFRKFFFVLWRLPLGILLGIPPLYAQSNSLLVSDILVESPAFVNPAQVLEDVAFYEELIKKNYARFEILAQNGVDWENVFFHLKAELTAANRQILTRTFMNSLIQTMSFTKDPTLQGELTFRKRIHSASSKGRYVPFYTKIRLAKQGGRFRALPNPLSSQIANQWFLHCDEKGYRFFPVVAERYGEERFVLGVLGDKAPTALNCVFEDGLKQWHTASLPLRRVPSPASNEHAIFTWTPGEIPYIRWMRDGRREEPETEHFFNLISQLNKHRTFILDVRGNQSGSFGFIERWLHPLTNAHWQNAIIQEKQSLSTLAGILNRLEYRRARNQTSHTMRSKIQKQQQRVRALLLYVERLKVPFRLVETKFSFSGDKAAFPWQKRMVVVANEHCGSGCQFLVALAKQLEGSFLVGENTGNYPKTLPIPLYQLPHSKIRVSLNHRLHLNHQRQPIAPSGHEPDFWLDHPAALSEIYRLARSR